MANKIPRIDPEEQITNLRGAEDLIRHLGRGALSTVVGGLAGLGNFPRGADAMEAARQAVTEGLAPGELSPEGIQIIQNRVAPAYHAIMDNSGPEISSHGQHFTNPTLGQNIDRFGDIYRTGVQHDADLIGKYMGPEAAGLVGAVGEAAPNAMFPEAGAERAVAGKLPVGVGEMMNLSRERLLDDGANAATLAKEATARRRMAEEGIEPTPYAEPFAGRQAEHESAVAQRQRPSHTIQMEPANNAQAPWAPQAEYPEDAMAFTARDPETGELLGRQIVSRRGDTMQSVRMDTRPDMQGQGIGTSLFQRALNHAHENGMDFASDTQVSAPAMKTYMKHPGDSFLNSAHEEFNDPADGPVLRSSNGQPIISFPRPQSDDFPTGQYVASQAYAGGGRVGILKELGALIKDHPPLKGIPVKATVPGVGVIDVGPHQPARDAAVAYMKEAGLPYNPPSAYAQVDPARAKQIAAAFEAMPHAPKDPAVKASYDAMINETLAQYQHMKKAGMNVEFMPPGEDPYAASPRLAAEDVRKNNHMFVYPTDAGFGSIGDDVSGNPLLAQSGEHFGGIPATHNDVFRAVHDYFGHAKEGVGFRANGEENAWRQHAGMYSDAARPAMTAETRGQNSWLNYGPHGDSNRTAKTADTVFAPQKTGILPDEFNNLEDPQLHFLHMSNLSAPEATLDPKFYGTGIKGAEARRGGTKTTSLYPWDIDPTQIEQGLESKTPYRVSVPKSSMYDISADPEGHLANSGNFSEAEDAIKDAGYAGYHVPGGEGLFRGQGRLFKPTPATRLGPGAPAAAEEDLSTGFAKGGEVGAALGDIGALVRRYAPEAEHLADTVATHGGITYNPTSGALHTSGYAVPTHPARSVALDSPPTPDDLHDFMMTHQDAFDEDPQAALHVHGDENGNSYLHVAHVTPDFEHASDVARQAGVPGFQDLGTGEVHGASTTPAVDVPATEAPDPSLVEKYLAGSSGVPTPWTPGKQTVANPKRNAFPGIYNDPRQVIADASSKVGPEDPLLQQLFGVSRSDLSDLALSRQGNELGNLPGATQNPTGAGSARDVMTPKNEQRLIDMMSEARKSPELFKGMTGWYAMDPLYERFRQLYGKEEAPSRYAHFNTMVGMASPGSDVGTEIARGTGAHWLNAEGRFNDFLKHGGGMGGDAPADMADLPGHVYHRTAQGMPMKDYLETGQIQMKSPKVPMYIAASGVPETGFQTETPVGDAHWARGVGLADTRGTRTSKGQEIVPGSSVSTPEMQTLAPWWRNKVAAPSGLESVPAQALAWGAYSPYTGVKSEIGAPKLEILSTQIGKLAARLGVSPETARDLVIQGKAGAFAEGGRVGPVLSGLSELVAKYAPDMKPITNTIYRGTEAGTPGAALRKSSDGEIGPGIYYTPHKWLASSYGGGPKASVKAGTRTVHEATVDQLAPEHVAYAWQPSADAGGGGPTYITSHTGDLLHTYDPLGSTPDAIQSRMTIPDVMRQHGVKMVVGHDTGIAGNQISVIDPSILKFDSPQL